ncbi:MAG TPA: pseudouridine synthase [Nitrospirales bacterium]
MRINKFFTEHGACSRRAADRLIEEGRVSINGQKAVLGDQVADGDVVAVDGRIIARDGTTVYLAYHKPIGVICTTEPDVPGNIVEAIGYPDRIFPVGRLDKDSSGLILLTNDGDIVNRILRAEFGHEREYLVTVNQPYSPGFLEQLQQGVSVLGKKTAPCRAIHVDSSSFRIILKEGRNRQIRRMCSALGWRVVRLVRIRIMHITLGKLPIGEWRHLSEPERDELLVAVGLPEDAARQDQQSRTA